MQRFLFSVFLVVLLLSSPLVFFAGAKDVGPLFNLSGGSTSDYYQELIGVVTGNWQNYGVLFTNLQGTWFWKVFLAIIAVVPGVFLLHYIVVGAKHFDHNGEQVLFFPLFIRIVHFFAAISFTLLAVTGLLIIFGAYLGGGTPILLARYIHLISAMVFVLPAILMFITWFKDMLPRLYDLTWIIIIGGYLSKKKKPVPAGKFNAGQKMYFWLATLGGLVMAYTGYIIWGMGRHIIETVRLYAIVHNVLGMAILAFFLTHVYMSVFAIAGSLQSMKTGYKPKEEVDILHSRFNYQSVEAADQAE